MKYKLMVDKQVFQTYSNKYVLSDTQHLNILKYCAHKHLKEHLLPLTVQNGLYCAGSGTGSPFLRSDWQLRVLSSSLLCTGKGESRGQEGAKWPCLSL